MLEKDPKKRPSIRKLKKHRWFHGMYVCCLYGAPMTDPCIAEIGTSWNEGKGIMRPWWTI